MTTRSKPKAPRKQTNNESERRRDRIANSKPKPDALLLRLKEFDEFLDKAPYTVMAMMTPQMKDDVHVALPRVIAWLSMIGSTGRAPEPDAPQGELTWRPCEEGEMANGRENVWVVKFRQGAFEILRDGKSFLSPFKTAASAKFMAACQEWPFD